MPVNLRRRPISLSQRRISSRLTIPMPVSLRLRPISLSQRRISSRLTIRMPVSPRRRPTSSRLTTRMPASPRRSRISRSQRRISRKARQFPTGARARGRAGGSETSAALLFRGSGRRSGRASCWPRYQPIPEPESPIATKPLTPPTTASKPPVETTVVSAVAAGVHQATAASGGAAAATSSTAASAAATPLFSPASSGPRVQVKEGIGPKLPRPNRVRVPTRRELASYGIKLPSQREAEQRARQAERDPHYDDELLSDEKRMLWSRMNWLASSPPPAAALRSSLGRR